MVHRLLQDSGRMSRCQGQQVREISSSKNLRSPSRRAKLAMLPRVQRMAPMMRQQLCRRPMHGTIPVLARRLLQDSSRKSRLQHCSGMGNVTRDKTGCAGSNCSLCAPNVRKRCRTCFWALANTHDIPDLARLCTQLVKSAVSISSVVQDLKIL